MKKELNWFQRMCIWFYKNDVSLLVRLGLKKKYEKRKYEKVMESLNLRNN